MTMTPDTHALYPRHVKQTVQGQQIEVGDVLGLGGLVTKIERNSGNYPNPADAPMKVETWSAIPDSDGIPQPTKKEDRPHYIPPSLLLAIYRLPAEEAPPMTDTIQGVPAPTEVCRRPECNNPGASRDLTPHGYDGVITVACDPHWAEWYAANPPTVAPEPEPEPELVIPMTPSEQAPPPEPEPDTPDEGEKGEDAPDPAAAHELPELSDEDRKKIVSSFRRIAKKWDGYVTISEDEDVLWLVGSSDESSE